MSAGLDTVADGIFHNWLQQQLGNVPVILINGNVKGTIQTVIKTQLLQGTIILHELDFLGQWNDGWRF